jgi:hypothetical protein
LAFASALVVLVASGVAISRLGSDNHSADRVAQTAAPSPVPESVTSGPAGQDAAAAHVVAAVGAPSSTPAPVPPPVPAAGMVRPRAGEAAASSTAAPRAAANAPSGKGMTSGAGDRSGATSGNGTSDNGGSAHEAQPGPERAPGSSALVTGSLSAGQGAGGAVVGVGLGDSPQTDVTVGTTHVIGDAPPSQGTGIGLGGRFLNPPPTVPVFPG